MPQDLSRKHLGIEELQADPGPAPEDDDESRGTAIQEVIADEVTSQVAKALMTIMDMVKESVEHLICAATRNAQGGIRTVLSEVFEPVVLDQIRKVVVGEMIIEHFTRYLEAAKSPRNLARGCSASTSSLPDRIIRPDADNGCIHLNRQG